MTDDFSNFDQKVWPLLDQGVNHNVYCNGAVHVRTTGGWGSTYKGTVPQPIDMIPCTCRAHNRAPE